MNFKKNDDDFIKSLIKSTENKQLEFKLKISSKIKIARTLAGMANSAGGLLLIGLSDQKKIIGIDPEEEKYMIESANDLFCVPKVALSFDSTSVHDFDENKGVKYEKNLLLVEITKSEHVKIYVKDVGGKMKLFVRKEDQIIQVT